MNSQTVSTNCPSLFKFKIQFASLRTEPDEDNVNEAEAEQRQRMNASAPLVHAPQPGGVLQVDELG